MTITMIFKYKDSAFQTDIDVSDDAGSASYEVDQFLQLNSTEIAKQVEEMMKST